MALLLCSARQQCSVIGLRIFEEKKGGKFNVILK